jgi:phosphoribosylglycinamide formyltransferase 1
MKPRLAILDSGDGDRLQAILDACAAGQLRAQVTVVVSSERESRALDRAEAAGIPALYHPFEWFIETGRSGKEYDAAIVELIAPYEPDWIVLSAWTRQPSAPLLERYADKLVDIARGAPTEVLSCVLSGNGSEVEP